MMTDKELVSHILGGNLHAFKLLIKQNERLVAHMVGKLIRNREEHEEICQDVFMKVYEKIGDFNFQSKLSTWIATIAYRLAINSMRRNRIQYSPIAEEENFNTKFISTDDPSGVVEEEDMDKYILQLVEALPSQYGVILTLYHMEHMNYAEIGEITGMPEGTVKNYLFRARVLLKEKIKNFMIKEIGHDRH
jgi:RNA polymerase sigma factor (sigma-70 family)